MRLRMRQLLILVASSSSSSSSFTYLPPPGTTTYCIQSSPCRECDHCNNHSESRVFDYFVPEFALPSSYFFYNIAIFFFSLFLLSSIYCIVLLRAPFALHCYAATIGLLLDIPTCEGAVSMDST